MVDPEFSIHHHSLFPKGQGGSHEVNIERWASQFATADGKPVAPKISSSKGGGNTEVTLMELHGTCARGVGMGPTGLMGITIACPAATVER